MPEDKVKREVNKVANDLDEATERETRPDSTADPETTLDARERDNDESNDNE